MNILDRRALHRNSVDIDASIFPLNKATDQFVKVRLISLNLRGLSFVFNNSFSFESNMYVRLSLSENIMFEGEIRKIWENENKKKELIFGFQFSKVDTLNYRKLSRYLDGISQLNVYSRRKFERREPSINIRQENLRKRVDRRSDIKTYPLYIAGRDIDTGNYEYCPFVHKAVLNPLETREVIDSLKKTGYHSLADEYIYGKYCIGDESHNRASIESAFEAYKYFSRFSVSKKRKIFDDIYNLLLVNKSALIDIFISEGHPKKLSEWEFAGMIRAFTSETVSFYKSEIIRPFKKSKGEQSFLIRKPDGVVCISPPKNAACSNSLTGALALLGGNTLVVKPPASLPIATMYMWKNIIDVALRKNGAPIGVTNLVIGNSAKFINGWIENPMVNDIIYFGESERGLKIGTKIYEAGKKPILELSGKDILIVWKDAELNSAAESLMDSFLGSTQICMVPKICFVHHEVFEKFKTIFSEKVAQMKVGLPTDDETVLSPVIKIRDFMSFLDNALGSGAKLVIGGNRINHLGQFDGSGVYLQPTVIEILDNDNLNLLRCVKEENFFPLMPLVRIDGNDENIFRRMVELTNTNEYGLRISVWAKSKTIVRKFVKHVDRSGLLRINTKHVDFSEFLATHGGPGKTGGPFGELNYFWQKTTHLQGVTIKD